MTDAIADYILAGVEVYLSAFLLSVIVTFTGITNDINQTVSYRSALSCELQDYRKVNQWDDKDVTQADVIQAILSNQGTPSIMVRVNGASYTWSSNIQATDYDAAEISAIVSNDYMYHSTIDTSSNNGELVSITFEAVSP